MHYSRIAAVVLGCTVASSLLGSLPVWSANSVTTSSSKQTAAANDDAALAAIEKKIDDPEHKPAEVLQELQVYLGKHPNYAKAHFDAGVVLDRMGYRSLAEQEFTTADKLDPTKPASALNLFRIKIQNDQLADAKSFLQYVAQRFPEDGSVYLMRGLLLMQSGRFEDAQAVFEVALKQNKSITGLPSALGVIRIKQMRFDEAVALTDKDLADNPNHPSALLVKGEALVRMGKYSEAIPVLEKAFATSPYEKKAAAALLATACANRGKYVQALTPALWNLGLASTRNDMGNSKNLVSFLLSQVSQRDAQLAINKVDEQMKDTVVRPRLHFALGDIYDKTDHNDLALVEYERGLQIDPQFGRANYRMGRDKFITGKYVPAISYCRTAADKLPYDPEVQAYWQRLSERMSAKKQDIAWSIKDWFTRH
jgi:tetratricopeptide (TPR) repeat protein